MYVTECILLTLRVVHRLTAGYTGLTGFGICFIFPPLLAYFSKRRLQKSGLETWTPFSNYLTSFPFQVILCVTGIVLFVVVGILQLTSTAPRPVEGR